MPKVKWGGDISVEDIDSAESGFTPYSGDIPTPGVYRFTLRHALQGKSTQGNPKIKWVWILDGSWKKEHKKYDGCPVFDEMPMTASSAFRAKAICAALGVSAKDIINNTVTDEDGYLTKIGKQTIEEGLEVYIAVKQENDPDYGKRLRLNGGGYLPLDDAEDAEEDAAESAEDGPDPF